MVSRMAFLADAAIIFGVGLGIFLLLSALRSRMLGPRVGRFAVVPAVSGLLLLLAIVSIAGSRLGPLGSSILDGSYATSSPALAIPFAIGIAGLGALLGEMALVVFPERLAGRRKEASGDKGSRIGVASSVVLIAILAIPTLAVILNGRRDAPAEGPLQLSIVTDTLLPGPPMDFEAVDDLTGYMSFASGEIALVHLPATAGDSPEYETVMEGLSYPRGLAVAGGRLYVTHLGPLTCDEPYPTCFGHSPEGEREIIAQSDGELLSFQIDQDGSLTDREVILGDLPVVNTEHGPNDVELGPDGALYLSVGHVDWMWETPDEIATIDHPNIDYLGTILRIDLSTGETSVHASGLRNVYGFDFDEDGRIYAADNDGPTLRGVYAEKVVAIVGGEYFGYPEGGAGASIDASPAMWQLGLKGSTDVEWIGSGTGSPGLLMGGPDRLTYMSLGREGNMVFVPSLNPMTDVMSPAGYVTVIERLDDGRFVAGVSGIYGGADDRLILFDLTSG